MQLLDDLKEQFRERILPLLNAAKEHPSVVSLLEKWESLTSLQRRVGLIGGGAVIGLILLMIPYSYYTAGSEALTFFEEKRALVSGLLKVKQERDLAPQLPPGIPTHQIQSHAEGIIGGANLIEEQKGGVQTLASSALNSPLIPKEIEKSAIRVTLNKLNLNQLIELGHQIQNLQNVKMTALQIEADSQDPHYFNVHYTLASFSLPQMPVSPPPTPSGPGKKKVGGK